MTNPKSTSWLRPRFTLGTLLILILLCALPLAYIARRRAMNAKRWNELQALTDKGFRFYMDGIGTPLTNRSAFKRTWLQAAFDDAPRFKRVELTQSNALGAPAVTADDSDLSRLRFFSEINEIDIGGAQNITDAGLKSLGDLPLLKNFAAQQLPLVDGSFLRSFGAAKSLEALSLAELPSLKGEYLAALREFRRLRGITLHSCPAVNSQSLRQVDLPAQLTHLRVGASFFGATPESAMQIDANVLSRWLSQTKLRVLWINAPITSDLVPALSQQTSLEALRIVNAPLVDADLEFLGRFRRLSDLHLTGLPATGRFLRAFSARPRLNFLALNSMPLADEELAQLSRFMVLQSLQVHYTPLEGQFLSDLRLPEFHRLDLRGTQFSDEGKSHLARMPHLISVFYPGNWTAADLRRYAGGAAPMKVSLCSVHRAEAMSLGARVDSYYPPWSEIDVPNLKTNAIDRFPSELMAPVIRLHDQARAEGEKLKKRDPPASAP